MPQYYPRDLIGYGKNPPKVNWPNGAKLAIQFVVNYEAGGENCILHGDKASEAYLSDIPNVKPRIGQRHFSVESCFEYGSRVGIWRLFDLFERKKLPLTLFAVAMALERNPPVAMAAIDADYEICCHGYRWINYQNIPVHIEREHLKKAIKSIEHLTGKRPQGWYIGRVSDNTRKLLVDDGGFLYDSDAYNDDLPYWVSVTSKPHLIIPYTLDNNDIKFLQQPGLTSDQFFNCLKDSFDTLYRESEKNSKMMTIGLHERIISRPGRINALERFLDYVLSHDAIWCCKRIDIAKHWHKNHPFDL